MIDIKRIIDVDQTVMADFFVEVRWNDPRLARTGGSAEGEIRRLEMDELWHPEIQVVNIARLFRQLPSRVFVDDSGQCVHRQRFVGSLSFPLDLHGFPFDRQTLHIGLVSALHTLEDVKFVINEPMTGRSDRFSVVDWEIGEAEFEARPVKLRQQGMTMAGFSASLPAQRYANYYIFKVIAPLLVIVAMSWAAFWIDPKQSATQIGMAATSLLTLIAYRFLLGNLVPKVSYLTRLDVFIFGATLLVFAALVEALTTSSLAFQDKTDLARRLQRWSRVLAPLCLLLLLWLSFA